MAIRYPSLFSRAQAQLVRLYGPSASFREGQYEAIEATLTRRRTLVVQRTGWGKSLVYFIATRLLRGDGKGLTLVVSPLLALMQNQMDAAKKLGLSCDALNHQTRDRREEILSNMADGTLDLVLVTPETLFTQDAQSMLPGIRIGLFVIDEAHCISDWGHDFRLEYSRLREITQQLSRAVPVLATTATANDRVVDDLAAQLGQDVYISRGPLTRESLWIQILNLPNRIDRYAWLLENVPKLPGSGIIYCLTQRDCDYIADFLDRHGISAMSYYSRDGEEEKKNVEAEKRFQNNRIKVLVATIKLGMGYDKGDIAFVIHFQMPSNIVAYYQQIGRAGRSIDRAYAVLMHGEEDEEIIEYFIRTAFPSEHETGDLRAALSEGGMRLSDLEQRLNMRRARLEKALSFLQNDGYIYREKQMYYASPKPYPNFRQQSWIISSTQSNMDAARIQRLLDRAGSLAFAINKFENAGIYVVTRADHSYPKRLKKSLGNSCPPLFYFAGSLDLMDRPAVGFAGSRTVGDDDARFTEYAVRKVVEQGYCVVSGGAKGVDSIAEAAALNARSAAVSYLSDSMLRKIKLPQHLRAIQDGRLLLLSAVTPDAGFHAGTAMMRNRYIYAQGQGTVIVRADYNKGGTWTGARDCIKHKWSPVLCWDNIDYPGNQALIQQGAIRIDEHWDGDVSAAQNQWNQDQPEQLSFFS